MIGRPRRCWGLLVFRWRYGRRPGWRPRRRGRVALLLAGLSLAGGAFVLSLVIHSGAATEVAGTAAVTDADTLSVAGQTIRLFGLDAPELRQTCRRADGAAWSCGQMAAAALAAQLRGKAVRCRLLGEDRFGRSLGRCWSGGEEINAWLVREGWALAYTRYSWRYLPQQTLAWWEGRGIWQGDFDAPEEWRRGQAR